MDERVLARVRALVAWAHEQQLTELSFRDGEFRLEFRTRLSRAAPPAVPVAPPTPTPPRESALPVIRSPLVGIFYQCPAPGSPPFVEAGSWVAPDTVVGLVEAMKVFNEITAEMTGRIRHIVVEDAQLVTAGQPLMEVEPGPERGRIAR